MEFNYIQFTEEWATIYKPMMHTPGPDGLNRRFFICDSYMNLTNFMEHMDVDCTPCVIVESQQEGVVQEGRDYPRYSFYFMVRAGLTHEGYSAYDAKSEAKKVMLDFINFIRAFKHPEDYGTVLSSLRLKPGSYLYNLRVEAENGECTCMENINIEDFTYESLNELYDTWYGVQVTLDDINVFDMCVDVSQYA